MGDCAICGRTKSDAWRFCSARNAFVCISCEHACEHYSRKLLSNGRNCKLTLPPKKKYRFLTLESEVIKARERYIGKTADELKEGFKLLEERYRKTDEPTVRSTIRARLAAIEELLEESGECLR